MTPLLNFDEHPLFSVTDKLLIDSRFVLFPRSIGWFGSMVLGIKQVVGPEAMSRCLRVHPLRIIKCNGQIRPHSLLLFVQDPLPPVGQRVLVILGRHRVAKLVAVQQGFAPFSESDAFGH